VNRFFDVVFEKARFNYRVGSYPIVDAEEAMKLYRTGERLRKTRTDSIVLHYCQLELARKVGTSAGLRNRTKVLGDLARTGYELSKNSDVHPMFPYEFSDQICARVKKMERQAWFKVQLKYYPRLYYPEYMLPEEVSVLAAFTHLALIYDFEPKTRRSAARALLADPKVDR
jgi:hypothetical protein